MLDSVINTKLLFQPLNWFIVFAFVLIWGYALAIVKDGSGDCGCDNGVPN